MDYSIYSGNFSVRGYLPLIRKDSITHTHVLAVYVKEELPFVQDVSLENCGFLLVFLAGFTSLSVLLICCTMAFLPLGNSDHVVAVSIHFLIISKQDVPFHRIV